MSEQVYRDKVWEAYWKVKGLFGSPDGNTRIVSPITANQWATYVFNKNDVLVEINRYPVNYDPRYK